MKMNNSVGTTLLSLDGPVLITGHTGFKGTWLVRYLKQLGVQAIGYSLPPEKDSLYERCGLHGEIVEQFGDIYDMETLYDFVGKHKPAAIIHLAAQAIVSESYIDPLSTFKTNVIGTANVLQVGKSIPGIKVIGVVTTDKVYQNRNEGKKFQEDDSILGSDPYSASKAACENVIEAWRNIPSNFEDFPIISLRAGNVIGGGDLSENRLIPDLVRAFQSGEEVLVRNPSSTRPWQHVLDPLTGYILAIEHALNIKEHATFNFGPKEPALAVSDVVRSFQDQWRKLKISVLSNPKKNYEAQLLDLDSSLASSILGWEPVFNQYSSIQNTIGWWEKNLIDNMQAIDCIDSDIENYLMKLNSDC